MRWLWRLFAVPFGLAAAVTVSGFVLLTASAVDPVMGSFAGQTLSAAFWALLDAALNAGDPGPFLDETVAAAGRLLATVLLAPPLFVALAGEVIGARRLLWHAGLTGLITGALPWLARGGSRPATPEELHIAAILALTGASAGFVYWLIAGHGAGVERPLAPSAAESPR